VGIRDPLQLFVKDNTPKVDRRFRYNGWDGFASFGRSDSQRSWPRDRGGPVSRLARRDDLDAARLAVVVARARLAYLGVSVPYAHRVARLHAVTAPSRALILSADMSVCSCANGYQQIAARSRTRRSGEMPAFSAAGASAATASSTERPKNSATRLPSASASRWIRRTKF
jgi:hypothetical protein